MGHRDIANIRVILDNTLDNIEKLIKEFRYQEAEAILAEAEGMFEQLEAIADINNETHKRILQNRVIRMDSLSNSIEEGLARREVGKKEDGNIAFKCSWNDKGYKGICSDAAYYHNIDRGRLWCTHQHGRCRKFVTVDPVPGDCCYEARALLDCSFGAGWDHDEYGHMIRPRYIRSAREGKVALLTTAPPGTRDRLVVGAFPIKKVWDDPGAETFVYGDKTKVIDDMLRYKIKFWDYYKNPNKPTSTAWATGLFRYVSDVSVIGILEEYISKKSAEDGDITRAEELLGIIKTKY